VQRTAYHGGIVDLRHVCVDVTKLSATSVWGPGLYCSEDADEAARWGTTAARQRGASAVYLHTLKLKAPPDRYIAEGPLSDAAYDRLETGLGRKVERTGMLPFMTLERRYGTVADGLRAFGFYVFEHRLNEDRPLHYLVLDPEAAASIVDVQQLAL